MVKQAHVAKAGVHSSNPQLTFGSVRFQCPFDDKGQATLGLLFAHTLEYAGRHHRAEHQVFPGAAGHLHAAVGQAGFDFQEFPFQRYLLLFQHFYRCIKTIGRFLMLQQGIHFKRLTTGGIVYFHSPLGGVQAVCYGLALGGIIGLKGHLSLSFHLEIEGFDIRLYLPGWVFRIHDLPHYAATAGSGHIGNVHTGLPHEGKEVFPYIDGIQ
ncbi:hypothetical protein D9M70_528800 [compost metagenome]